MTNRSFQSLTQTSQGDFIIEGDNKCLTRLGFPKKVKTQKKRVDQSNYLTKQASKALNAYFKGDFSKAQKVKIDLASYTRFEKKVIRELLKIKAGKVITYGELARRAGHPGAARAVGSVMRKNPLPIFIPCHRVVGANRSLGGYSLGVPWKKRLLALEKANFAEMARK